MADFDPTYGYDHAQLLAVSAPVAAHRLHYCGGSFWWWRQR